METGPILAALDGSDRVDSVVVCALELAAALQSRVFVHADSASAQLVDSDNNFPPSEDQVIRTDPILARVFEQVGEAGIDTEIALVRPERHTGDLAAVIAGIAQAPMLA
jgi:hypothetical protein